MSDIYHCSYKCIRLISKVVWKKRTPFFLRISV